MLVLVVAGVVVLCLGSVALSRREGFSTKRCFRHTYLDAMDKCLSSCDLEACLSVMGYDITWNKLSFDRAKLRNYLKAGPVGLKMWKWISQPRERNNIKKHQDYK